MNIGLDGLLKPVSRSMYLSFRVLPPEVRQTLSLGYLLCRAADTLIDTRLIPREKRLRCLDLWAGLLEDHTGDAKAALGDILAQLPPRPDSNVSPERKLLEEASTCFEVLHQLSPPERSLVQEVVHGVLNGMRMDLQFFPGAEAQALGALPSLTEYEEYCRWIGGAPGAFWTKLCLLKFQGLTPDAEAWTQEGIRLGVGLQMTNILRDIAADLRIGRCYLPSRELSRVGLRPEDLLEPRTLERLRPLLHSLLRKAAENLSSGESYVLKLPRNQLRLRAAAAWPLLLAYKTLQKIAESDALLDPKRRVKVPRWSVYFMLAESTVAVPFDAVFRSRCRRLHDRVLAATQNPPPLS